MELRGLGFNPFAYGFERTHTLQALRSEFGKLRSCWDTLWREREREREGLITFSLCYVLLLLLCGRGGTDGVIPPGEERRDIDVTICGRVIAKRTMGKLMFIRLGDEQGEIQLYVEKAVLNATAESGDASTLSFPQIKSLIDIGDMVGAAGHMRKTEKGELSVAIERLVPLSKALRPLPDKWQGLKDVEKRYRQRYLDLITNPGEYTIAIGHLSSVLYCV